MKNFCCSGTAGDSFINLCKLYRTAKKEKKIRVFHYTVHTEMWDLIRQIYQMVPNIWLTFLKDRGRIHPTIESHFDVMEKFLDVEPFPDFGLKLHIEIAEMHKVTYAPRAGKQHEDWRKIPVKDIPKNGVEVSPETCDTIEVAFAKIANSLEFMGYQGLMCYFALSQKIPTTVYIGPDNEVDAFKRRVLPEWEEDIKEIRRV